MSILGALLFLVVAFALYLFTMGYSEPKGYYSSLADLEDRVVNWRERIVHLPKYLGVGALTLFIIAFANPYTSKEISSTSTVQPPPSEGVAIYLVLDQSGSMSGTITAYKPDGARAEISKLELLKQVSKEFIQERPQDLVGVVSFARAAQVVSPLTLDHASILNAISKLQVVPAIEDDGTAIGYALYKTSSLIAATRHYAQDGAYAIKGAVIVLVTDGLQDPNPKDIGNSLRTMDLEEAATFAKENQIKLYIINVEPKLAEEKFAPNRRQLEKITALTGGQFFMADYSHSLGSIFQEINQMEKTTLPPAPAFYQEFEYYYFYPWLVGLGLVLLLLSILFKTTLLRTAP